MRLEELHPTWQREQRENLIIYPPKQVASDSGYSLKWIYTLQHGERPAAAITAFHLSRVQEDIRYLQALAVRYGYLLLTRPLPKVRRSPIVLLGDFAAITSRVVETLIAKIHKGEMLTQEEAAEAERLIDKGHADLEALREEVRKQRKEEQP